MNSSFEGLKEKGLEIGNLQLFRTALTHSSYIHESKEKQSNERLEFLGDAVLDLVIAETLYLGFPEWPEGVLSRVRSSLVRESVLAEVAQSLHLGAYLRMGKGEENSGGREKKSILADSFEALLGAIYLDQGLAECQRFIKLVMGPWIAKAADYAEKLPDFKTRLQELLQVQGNVLIQYQMDQVDSEKAPTQFSVSVWINGVKHTTGTGKSKKEAEQEAAKKALSQLEK